MIDYHTKFTVRGLAWNGTHFVSLHYVHNQYGGVRATWDNVLGVGPTKKIYPNWDISGHSAIFHNFHARHAQLGFRPLSFGHDSYIGMATNGLVTIVPMHTETGNIAQLFGVKLVLRRLNLVTFGKCVSYDVPVPNNWAIRGYWPAVAVSTDLTLVAAGWGTNVRVYDLDW